MIRTLFARNAPQAPAKSAYKVLIASEGRRFTGEVIDAAERLCEEGGKVRIITVARLWGSSLGLPNPGLRPSPGELAEQNDNVSWAIQKLADRNIVATGHIVVSRDPAKSILRESRRCGCENIVMTADPRRSWVVRGFMWSQTPYTIERRAHVPFVLLPSRHA